MCVCESHQSTGQHQSPAGIQRLVGVQGALFHRSESGDAVVFEQQKRIVQQGQTGHIGASHYLAAMRRFYLDQGLDVAEE